MNMFPMWGRGTGTQRVVAFILALTGCDSHAPEPTPTTPTPLPHWTLERELTIGSLDDASQTLTATESLVVDTEGRIYVSQKMEQEVKVFSPEGDLLFSLGRRGEGPGEFSRPGAMGWLADTLWVSEIRIPKVSFFQKDGAFVRSHLLRKDRIDEHFSPSRIDHVFSDGSFLVPTTSNGRLVLDGSIVEFPSYRMDAQAEVMAKLGMIAMGNSLLRVPLSGGRGFGGPHPLPTRPLLAAQPGANEFVMLDRLRQPDDEVPTLRLHKISSSGDTLFTREIPCPDLTFPGYYVDSVARPVAERIARSGSAGSVEVILPAVKEALDLEANAPLALQMVVATNGDIWIQRTAPGVAEDQWEIYSGGGEPVATLSAPQGTTIHWVDGRQVWSTELDRLDVPYVVLYGVVGAL